MGTDKKEIVIPEGRDFKGVWIYKNLYLSRDYSPNEKFLLLEIYSLSNSKDKKCYANNRHFADFIGVKENTIQKAILKLERNGHIKREYIYRDETKEIVGRTITLTQKFYDDFINESEAKDDEIGGGKKSTGGGGKKSIQKYNNYDLSNTNAFSESKDSSKVDIYAFQSDDCKVEVQIIRYFADRYLAKFNKKHIPIDNSLIEKIRQQFYSKEHPFEDLTVNDYKYLVEKYLETDYTKTNRKGKIINHSLTHMFSGKVLEYLICKYLL